MFVSVLGIDPGLTRCGYGFVRKNSNRSLELVNAGILSTSPQGQISSRLAEMHSDLNQLISELKPDVIAIERVVFAANSSTAMSVGQVSGLVHSIAASNAIEVVEYSPTEVKNSVTGDGRADKVQVQTMVMKMLGLTKIPKPADASDAIAIALTHIGSLPVSSSSSDSAIYNGSKLHNSIADAIYKSAKKQPKVLQQDRRRVKKRTGLSR